MKLQQNLVTQTNHDCKVCQSMLMRGNFDADKVRQIVEAADNGDLEQLIGQDEVPKPTLPDRTARAGKDERKDKRKGRKGKKVENQGSDQEDEEDGGNTDADIASVVQHYAPYLKLLPRGSHGKRVPYLCTLCSSRTAAGCGGFLSRDVSGAFCSKP